MLFEAAPNVRSALLLETLGLTPRGADVLVWVVQGKVNSSVATIRCMSEKTVNIHLGHIVGKLSVETRTAAARMTIEKLTINALHPKAC